MTTTTNKSTHACGILILNGRKRVLGCVTMGPSAPHHPFHPHLPPTPRHPLAQETNPITLTGPADIRTNNKGIGPFEGGRMLDSVWLCPLCLEEETLKLGWREEWQQTSSPTSRETRPDQAALASVTSPILSLMETFSFTRVLRAHSNNKKKINVARQNWTFQKYPSSTEANRKRTEAVCVLIDQTDLLISI